MSKHFLSLLFLSLALALASSCTFMENRSFVGQMDGDDPWMRPGEDFRVVNGDSGQVYRTRDQVLERTPRFGNEALSYNENRSLEEELRRLEESLPPQEYQHYLNAKDSLATTSDRIYFLKIPSVAERDQYLTLRNQGRNPAGFNQTDGEMTLAVRNRDLLLGMSKDQVNTSWGRPTRVDVAGNPKHQNERWSYYRGGQFKFVYFDSGRVQGWDNGE